MRIVMPASRSHRCIRCVLYIHRNRVSVAGIATNDVQSVYIFQWQIHAVFSSVLFIAMSTSFGNKRSSFDNIQIQIPVNFT